MVVGLNNCNWKQHNGLCWIAKLGGFLGRKMMVNEGAKIFGEI
jgi:hypothetical protein